MTPFPGGESAHDNDGNLPNKHPAVINADIQSPKKRRKTPGPMGCGNFAL